jgi:hypothetical protein
MTAVHNVASDLPVIHESPETALATAGNGSRALAAAGGAGSVADMINFAIEKNVPVESLERLFGLYERMAARDAAREFNEALAAFQQVCPAIKKAKTAKVARRDGGEFSYTYADLPEIKHTVDPILAKHGLSYSWDSDADAKGLMKITCTLRHINGHSVSSSMTLPVENAAAMSPQQKFGAAMTYGQRRTLANVLGITIEDESPEVSAAADPRPINEDQVVVLADLVKESGANLSRFLKHFGITKLDELRATEYQRAVDTLNDVKAKRAERKS